MNHPAIGVPLFQESTILGIAIIQEVGIPINQLQDYMDISLCGVFQLVMGVPSIAGWFIVENTDLKWMMTGGTPIPGNLPLWIGITLIYMEILEQLYGNISYESIFVMIPNLQIDELRPEIPVVNGYKRL